MDPIHSISDILKHALERNEKISIFKAHLTTVEAKIKRSHKMPNSVDSLLYCYARGTTEALKWGHKNKPCISGAATEEVNQAGKEVCL